VPKATEVEPSQTIAHLTDAYYFDRRPQPILYCTGETRTVPGIQVRRLNALFTGGIIRQKDPSFIPEASWTSHWAKLLPVVTNSLRLLTWILAVTGLLAALAAGLSNALVSGSDADVESFQRKHASRLVLEQRLDSLEAVESQLSRSLPVTMPAASIVGVFCQRRFKELFLRRISVSRTAMDSILAEIQGAAAEEATVFKYHNALAEFAHPIPIVVRSVLPEIVHERGSADTLTAFSFSMELHADQQ
jgi:hypothetical protein